MGKRILNRRTPRTLSEIVPTSHEPPAAVSAPIVGAFQILRAASVFRQHLLMARRRVRRYLVAGNRESDLEGSDVARSKTPKFASRQQPMREAAVLKRLDRNSVEAQAHRG
jgi:hypothetical protein